MSDQGFSLLALFRDEVSSNTASLGQGLLDLENDPDNPQKIEPLMRAAHSIKGAARIVGIGAAVRLAHVMEDALVAAQHGKIRLTPSDIDVLLRGTDVLAGCREVTEENAANWSSGELAELIPALEAMAAGTPESPAASGAASAPRVPAASSPRGEQPRLPIEIPLDPIAPGDDEPVFDLFREELRSHALLLRDGLLTGPVADSVGGLAHAAHAVRGAARIVGLGPLADLAAVVEDVLSAASLGHLEITPDTRDLLLRSAAVLAAVVPLGSADAQAWLGEHQADITDLAGRLGRLRSTPVPAPAAAASVPRHLPAAPPQEAAPAPLPAPGRAVQAEPAEAVVRVTAQSLTRLISLAGESLVQARWLQPFATALLRLKKHHDHLAGMLDGLAADAPGNLAPGQIGARLDEVRQQMALCRQVLNDRMREFEDHAASAEGLNTRLYREVIVSRMRPFADGAHGFPRLVRDMARDLGKQVRLEITGQQTEVDRDILERLEAPLMHLLRNAVDHGIERPEVRRGAGKPEQGVVRLDVQHRAGMLAITISDDGAGIDLNRLRQKIVERGMSSPEMASHMTDAELLEFLFLAGFSTARELTEYSGRGVGLDVVQDTLRKIGGSVRISARAGQGTSFHLRLPVTLSVLRAVLVEVAGETYAFPHNRIDRLIRVPRSEIRSLEHRQFVHVDGQNVGLVLAAQLLELQTGPPREPELPVVLMSDPTGQYGLIVEAFLGEQDLVVRPLDPRLGKVPNLSAAAVLDDGGPVLIADVDDLVRSMDRFIQSGTLRRSDEERQIEARRKRVLVVDDSITVREVERQLLRNNGYEVDVAVDGRDGWNQVRASRYDLVVTDVDMPRMTGLELLKAIRDHEPLRGVPVVIVSYKDRAEDRRRGLELGANFYLTKSSFHDDTFLRAVADLIGEA